MNYLLSLLITSNLLVILFLTNITVHFVNAVFRQEFYSRDDVSNWLLANRHYNLAEWYGCPLCFGTWLACAVSLAVGLVNKDYWLIPAATFSHPLIAYYILSLVSTRES